MILQSLLSRTLRNMTYVFMLLCLISIGSIPILFIVGNTLKTTLFLFQLLISIYIFVIFALRDRDIVIPINNLILSILMLIFFFGLILLYTKIESNLLIIIKIFSITIFLTIFPGYLILNLLGITNNSLIITILQSFAVGYFISSFLFIFLRLTVNSIILIRFLYFILYILLTFLTFIKNKIEKKHFLIFNRNLVVSFKDLFGLLVLFILFCYAYSIVTPYGVFIIDTDFSRHYMYDLIFIRSPNLFYTYPYFLFDIFTALLLLFFDFSPSLLYLTMTFLNFLNNIGYYVLLKIYTKNRYKHLPVLALFIYSLFSSFAWINFLINKLTFPFSDQIHIYWSIWSSSYMSFLFTPGLWFFEYGPQYISNLFMLIFLSSRYVLFSLKNGRQKLRHYGILSFILISSILSHVLPPFIFIATLCIVYLVDFKASKVKEEELILIAGSVFLSVIILIASSFFFTFVLNFMYLFSILALALFSLFVFMLKHYFGHLIQNLVFSVKRLLKLIFIAISLIMILSFIYYVIKIGDFRPSEYYDIIGEVPWYFYSYMLGLSGILALLGIYDYLSNTHRKYELTFFLVGSFFVVALGRLVTLFNRNLFHTYIWEYRIFRFMPMFIAPFSAIMLEKIYKYLSKHKTLSSRFLSIAILSLLIMAGAATSFLTIEYQSLVANAYSNKLSSSEFGAVNWIKAYLNNSSDTLLITLSNDRLYHVVAFAGPPYRILVSWRNDNITIWEELSTMILNISKIRNILLISYKNNPEAEELKKRFSLKEVFSNGEIEIYQVEDGKRLIEFIYTYGKREILKF